MTGPRIEAAAKAVCESRHRHHKTKRDYWTDAGDYAQGQYRDDARAALAAADNAATIATVEELEALPLRSIVACMGIAPGTRNVPVTLVWQRGSVDNGGSDWCMPDTQGQITAMDVFYFLNVNQLRQELTVLHRGQA
ncbi:hypothetical protein FQ154_01735 [Paeniglutamicibacter gangotriensis]|uniref:Uncharacterized protein n=1 Tax=Paeniglutamicibacter gangotriensis TaxID=254787 RepID=A0A5B0EM99_9MICC|nr:hypothetical protein [Paeniglutamicibacter gangotriensis]KAA0979906.1 hypothetical protein FQ154_01735 [Paeniglutamicibacter gangotriensis]